MGVILDLLAEKKILVSDGAWGTMLQAAGMSPQDCTEEWNISHPDAVRSVAAAYAEAGSDIVLSNTFGGSSIKLDKQGMADRVKEFNLAGARLSLEGAGDKAVVAASVGPTGELLQPFGLLTEDELAEAFTEQVSALLEAGVKAVCVETMTVLEEAVCAVKAARALSADIDIICTMTYDPAPDGFRTVMGISPEQAVPALVEAGANIIGSNCGNGIERMIDISAAIRKHTDKPILIHANAGLPELIDDQTVFKQKPEDMAKHVKALVEAGASIIGGCCGTTPAHIAAMKAEVEKIL